MPETEVLEPEAAADEAGQTTEVPADPAGDPSSAPVVETVATEPTPTASRSRGPDGRFIKADGTQATEAEHAAMEAAPPPAIAPTPTPPAPSVPVGDPFVFKADGQRIPIPGGVVNAEGTLTIPADQVPVIRQLLAEGVAHRGSWRQQRQELESRITEASAVSEAKAEKYNRAAVMLWDRLADANWLAAAAQDPREIEYLRRELGLELKSADLDAPKPRTAPAAPVDEQAQYQQLEAAAKSTLSDVVEELLDTPQAKAIYATPQDRTEATNWYLRHLNTYVVERDGGYAVDTEIVKADFADHMKVRTAGRQAAAAQAKATEFNAARNRPAVVVPPVVSPKGPGGTGQNGSRVFKDKDEYRRAMGLP